MTRKVASLIAKVAVALVLFWTLLRLFEHANLYFPSRQLHALPKTYGMEFEEVRLETSDRVRLHGWFVPGSSGGWVLLFCHGNGGNISDRVEKLKLFHDIGLSTFIFDYRGYGLSSGWPTEKGTYRDGEAAYRYLTETKGIRPERIVLYGESLGAAIAIELASRLPAGALVAESAFTSVVEMGRRVFPFLPVRWMVHFKYDNLAKISKVGMPALFLHSPQDDIVPYDMAETLFRAAPDPKELVQLKGGHNDGFLETGRAYPQSIRDFLKN